MRFCVKNFRKTLALLHIITNMIKLKKTTRVKHELSVTKFSIINLSLFHYYRNLLTKKFVNTKISNPLSAKLR